MAKYLIEAKYTAPSGVSGLMKDGGSARRAAVQKLLESLGGKVESFYFSFGETDTITIVELPDNVSAATVSIVVAASGQATLRTTPLMTAEEIDQAVKKSVTYTPPGG